MVALIGGECTGKSTLAADLAAALPGVVIPEALRQWCLDHGRTPRRDEQRAMMALQISAEEAARSEGYPWLVCDPATLMTAVYSDIYFDDDSLLDDAIAHADEAYDCIIWCDRDLPWQPDEGQRDGVEWRDRAHDLLAAVLPRLTIPVVLVSGPPPERVESALSFLSAVTAD